MQMKQNEFVISDESRRICNLYNFLIMAWGEKYHYNSIVGAWTGLYGLIDSQGHEAVNKYLKNSFGMDIKLTQSGTRLKVEIEILDYDY